jgi:Tol biopolymer transport system component/DNA-binding winged helix-turn-helix (wHTH) protein
MSGSILLLPSRRDRSLAQWNCGNYTRRGLKVLRNLLIFSERVSESAMSNQEQHFYEFGPFRLDPLRRRLLRDNEPVPLTPKAFETLLALVQNQGKTIEKDDLMRRVWPDAVVEENNLNQNITALRKSLGDSRQQSQYIATVPGFGYRFVAEVKKSPFGEHDAPANTSEQAPSAAKVSPTKIALQKPEEMATAHSPADQADLLETRAAPENVEPLLAASSRKPVLAILKEHRRVSGLFLALVVVGSAAIGIWVYRLFAANSREAPAAEIEVTALTRTGTTGIAAISPDGRYIVYSVHEAGRASLWLRQVAASSAQEILPPSEVSYSGLTFSRDGNRLNFLRSETDGGSRTLYRMPALGGVPTRLSENVDSPVTWSPDDSRMAFIRNSGNESALIIANADGSDEHQLASRPMTDYFKVPAWSPDGKEIACSSGSGEPYDFHNCIVTVRVEDGSQKPITPKKWAWTNWVEWLSDGSGLLITARDRHEDLDQIWRISYPGGDARRLTSDSKMYRSISLTSDSRTMVAVQTELLSDIWVVPDWENGQAKKITFGTGSYESACFTPDGRIVYSSAIGGNWDIWMMNADGSSQKQLTAEAGVNVHQCVSPDGRYIVFASNRAGVFNIWRMDADGSNPIQLTRGNGEKFAQCSPDAKWIIYNTVASDQDLYSVWKIPIDGGEPVRLTTGKASYPVISPDGKRIAYFEEARGKARIAVIPFSGGEPPQTVAIPAGLETLGQVRWFPDGQSLTYVAARNGAFDIWRQPLNGGDAKQITNLKVEGRINFDWSRDGKRIVFLRRLWPSDLVLLRNAARKTF